MTRTVLNSLFFLRKDFARTESTKSAKTQPSKSTKRYKRTVRVWWFHHTKNSTSIHPNKNQFFGTVQKAIFEYRSLKLSGYQGSFELFIFCEKISRAQAQRSNQQKAQKAQRLDQAKAQKHKKHKNANKRIKDFFPLRCFLSA